MRIAVPRETTPGERRVAIVPESVKRLAAKKIDASVEAGAGMTARVSDDEYKTAGAAIEPTFAALAQAADLVVRVRAPSASDVAAMKEGAALISPLYPLVNGDVVKALLATRPADATPDMPVFRNLYRMRLFKEDLVATGIPYIAAAAGTRTSIRCGTPSRRCWP